MSDNFDDIFGFNPNENEENKGDEIYSQEGSDENTEIYSHSESQVDTPHFSEPHFSEPQVDTPQVKEPQFSTQYTEHTRPYTNPYVNPYAQESAVQSTRPQSQESAQPQPYSYSGEYNYSNPYSQNTYTREQHASTPVPPEKKKERRSIPLSLVALLLVVTIVLSAFVGFAGSMLYSQIKLSGTEISDNGAMIINKVDIDEETAQTLSDKPTSQITDEVADTVVEITTEIMSTNSFYGQYVSQGAGSGVIISSDGYIVTNNHVIDGASSITVTLRDQTSYKAQLVGKDSVVDVALLKIDATSLKCANFGDSDKLKVGDKAVAIGNPLGQLGGTVTDGIISALDRDVVIDDETMSLLQTDSAINPGNSGGGLFDGQGALIGIVVAKSSGEEIEGLGFAIPINDVVDILDDLKEYGYVRGRVTVGMQLIDLTNSMYSMYYYGNSQDGCYVYSVDFDSAAYKAGIQQGDRIVSINGNEVKSTSDVEAQLDDKKVGDTVTLEIERGGRTASVDIVLDEYVPADVIKNENADNIFNPFE